MSGPYRTTYLGFGEPTEQGFETTLREYWRDSYNGAYLPDFEIGYTAGQADLTANGYDAYNALDAVEVSLRDLHWQAQMDGYIQITKPTRGRSKYG